MLRVMGCESGGDPTNVGPHGRGGPPNDDGLYDYGLFMIHGEPQALDPVYNVRRAHEKFEEGGLAHWASSRECWG